MEEIKVSEMLQADSINKDDSVMIIQEGVNKKASGSIQTATGTSLSLTSVADTCKVKSNSKNLFDKDTTPTQNWIFDTANTKIIASANGKSTYIPCKASTTYTISKISAFRFQVATTSTTPAIDVAYSDYIENNDGTTITITTGASAQYIVIYYWHPNSGIAEQLVLDSLQIEEGSTATNYNPYNTEVIIADGDVSSPTIEAGTIQQATGQNATGSRMRSAGYIDVEPNKEYTLNADGNTAVVFEYKSDNTYIHRIPDNWIETPYTFTTTSETAKVRFVLESPNVTQDQIAFQEGSKSQKITLTPQEEKSVFTYDTKTGVLSDGSVTIEYNTQSRLLNNDDTTAIKEYVDRETELEILWENPNSTIAFAEQDMSLKNSNYNFLEVLFVSHTTNEKYLKSTGLIPKGNSIALDNMYIQKNYTSTIRLCSRLLTYTNDSTLHANKGYYATSFSSSSENNEFCVPIKVIGYK